MAIYSEKKKKTAADSSHTGNIRLDVKRSWDVFPSKTDMLQSETACFHSTFVVCTSESVCRQNYESITLTFVTIGLCTVNVHMDFS